ncbi:MAG: sodium:proton antiporter, partial [Chitinophagaceae bacterium]
SWTNQLAALITLAALLPFLWALAVKNAYTEETYNVWSERRYRGAIVLLQIFRILLAIFFIGFFLDKFISQEIALFVVVILIVVLIFFSRRIQSLYFRLENRFMINLNTRELEKLVSVQSDLAPWDAHMANFEIPPGSEVAGKTLQELRWRERFGINIAAIERGANRINVPARTQVVYPYDNLSVIGTDEQIQSFNQYLESSESQNPVIRTRTEISLERVTITYDSPFVNQTIGSSGIREITHGLVVGVEHDNERILNPESNYMFEEGDVVWIAGNRLRILALQKH